MNEEEKQLLLTAVSERQMLVTAISGLCVAIVSMAGYIIHLHGKYSKIINEYSDKYREVSMQMIQSNFEVSKVIENLTEVMNRFWEQKKEKK